MAAIKFRTLSNDEVHLKEEIIADFTRNLRGEVIREDNPRYDEARKVYNAMHDRSPSLIVQAVDAADVMASVRFAQRHGLLLAVRGGGHGIPGFGTCDGGLVIDLGRMRGLRVDPDGHSVRAEGGCTWGDLNHAAHAFGLATTGGIVSTTGIAGLTLGGGLGFLARSLGLSCDNLLSADVVTADGSFLTCDQDRETDLFWALRGGGGNFGVVISFEFRLHPVAEILGGPTFYPLEGDVMHNYHSMIAEAPRELGAIFGLALGPPLPFLSEKWHGRPVCIVLTCWSGSSDKDEQVRGQLDSLGPVAGQFLERMPYPVINTLFDDLLPAGLHHYWKGNFLKTISDEAVDVHMAYGAKIPSPETATLLFPIDAACHDVAADQTAFAYRDAAFATALGPSWSNPAHNDRNIQWGRDYFDALRPHSEAGGYVNFMSDDDQQRVRTNYRRNYERLAKIKSRYDPTNLFRLNHNIPPLA